MKKKAIIAIATLLAFGQGAWADETPTPHFSGTINPGQENEQNGSESKPYLISSIEDLNHLAEDVNSGIVTYYEIDEKTQKRIKEKKGYADVYFKLNADLDYSTVGLTDGSNFTPIGTGDEGEGGNPFAGIFDGNDRTIKGITVKQDNAVGIGLFGYIASPAVIKNLNLTGCSFTGNIEVGAIAGTCSGSTDKDDFGIFDCNVSSTTVSAVTVSYYDDDKQQNVNLPGRYTGGIIGIAGNMTLSGCTSSATVTGSEFVGGIVGKFTGVNGTHDVTGEYLGIITDCFYTGSSTFTGTNKGVIVGFRGPEEEEDQSQTKGTINLTLLDDDSNATIKNATRLSNYNGLDANVTLSGRTLFKDEAWNTLCLPFDVTQAGSYFEDATVMTLGNSPGCHTGFDASTGTLTLDFVDAYSINAGHAYIVKWTTPGDPIVDPVFHAVTIQNEDLADQTVTFTGGKFVGTYDYTQYTTENNSILFLGAENTLYWPKPDLTDLENPVYPSIGAFRAYFQLNGITVGEPTTSNEQTVRAFNLSFGDDSNTTGIDVVDSGQRIVDSSSDTWYTLDGRKLSGEPTKKGMYIKNGKVVVIK